VTSILLIFPLQESTDHSICRPRFTGPRNGWTVSSIESKCLDAVHDRLPTLQALLESQVRQVHTEVLISQLGLTSAFTLRPHMYMWR